jgi:hypothetical protein
MVPLGLGPRLEAAGRVPTEAGREIRAAVPGEVSDDDAPSA